MIKGSFPGSEWLAHALNLSRLISVSWRPPWSTEQVPGQQVHLVPCRNILAFSWSLKCCIQLEFLLRVLERSTTEAEGRTLWPGLLRDSARVLSFLRALEIPGVTEAGNKWEGYSEDRQIFCRLNPSEEHGQKVDCTIL